MVDTLVPHREVATATGHEQVLAWMTALGTVEPSSIEPLLAAAPDADDLMELVDLAATIARLAEELAGDRITFGQVAEQAERLSFFGEGDRWRALEALERVYLNVLGEAGLVDPQNARWEAIQRGGPTDRRLVMVGVADLNAMQRAVAAKWPKRSVALIHAPAARADHFDELGCVQPARWAQVTIDIDDRQLVVADRPDDQAQAVLLALADLDGAYTAEEITVGLGDESLAEIISRAGAWAGLSLHAAAGRELTRTGPFRLLAAGAEWLADQQVAHLAAIVRHPDFEDWWWRRMQPDAMGLDDVQTVLDKYCSRHLPRRSTGWRLGGPDEQRLLQSACDAANDLFAPLGELPRRPLGDWAGRVIAVLREAYAAGSDQAQTGHREPLLAEALGALRDVCTELAAAPSTLQPTADGPTALRLLLARAAPRRLPVEPRRGEIEMLGWLELLVDDAPAAVVAGFNEGYVPAALTGDAFLPDALRRTLGLTHNARRYARDAYIAEALRRGRPDLSIVMGRHTSEGEPLAPSRLLLACDHEKLARRVAFLCNERADAAADARVGGPGPGPRSRFKVPRLPVNLEPPREMSVTDFRKYLECPYRWALAKLLGLRTVTDDVHEMDALAFGELIHDVLLAFGQEAVARSSNADEIEAYLIDSLRVLSCRRFGDDPLPAVRLQIARAAQRLRSFADLQAAQRAGGWVIEHCELEFSQENRLELSDREDPMTIKGRIDRIDRHEVTGAYRIIDYKTGESGHGPHWIHHGVTTVGPDRSLQWKDLQLPLYHHLAVREGITGDVCLGYIVLPRQSDGAAFKSAEWTAEQLDDAVECARAVVRNIRAGRFDANPDYTRRFDEFARICQTFAFGDDDTAEVEP
jgi:hypothetical protein